MSHGWPMVCLGKVLSRFDDWVDILPDEQYRQVTVRLWGRGVVQRAQVTGAQISATRQRIVRSNQFLVSRIDARNGACGLVPDMLDGAVVSSDFPTFDIDQTRLLPEFLEWMSKTSGFVDLCKGASEGTTNRVRLKEERFLATKIALPAISEQRRIVARIEELAAKIDEACRLHWQAMEQAEAVLGAELNQLFGNPYRNEPGHLRIESFCRLNDAVTDVADGPHVTPIYVEGGVPFVTVLNITAGRVDFSGAKHVALEDHRRFQKRARVDQGDVLITKDGTIGIPCFVDTDQEFSFFVSVALVKPRRDVLDGGFLTCVLRSPYLQGRMRERSRGDMIRHLVLREIRDLCIPVPPLSDQRRIAAHLGDLQSKVNALKRLQAECAVELDALLPSVLDKAFKGEL